MISLCYHINTWKPEPKQPYGMIYSEDENWEPNLLGLQSMTMIWKLWYIQ